jgi:hypothetical protein
MLISCVGAAVAGGVVHALKIKLSKTRSTNAAEMEGLLFLFMISLS